LAIVYTVSQAKGSFVWLSADLDVGAYGSSLRPTFRYCLQVAERTLNSLSVLLGFAGAPLAFLVGESLGVIFLSRNPRFGQNLIDSRPALGPQRFPLLIVSI